MFKGFTISTFAESVGAVKHTSGQFSEIVKNYSQIFWVDAISL
jgi:hypothetical protein